jgi:hypothetical protein
MVKRTVMRSSKGKKLYAVRNKKGEFKDIQQYSRAHAQDIKRGSKAEKTAARKKTAKKATKRRGAKKTAAKRPAKRATKRTAKRTTKRTAKRTTKRASKRGSRKRASPTMLSRARKAVGRMERAVTRAVKRATS